MRLLKRFIMLFVLLDNWLTNLPKKYLFKTRWIRIGKCQKCGQCCKEIYLKIEPRQLGSALFTKLAVAWISWLFDFNLLRIDRENHYLVFNCRQQLADGRCGNYFWRPSVCRNYPLVDYFDEPKFIPGCGYSTRLR